MNKQLINEIVDYVYDLYEEIQQLHEIVRLGNQEIISRSDAMRLMSYSAKFRQIFTVEFIKRTDGTKRVMNGMTGVRRYVNGRGMPYDNIAKGLMTVYDLRAPGSGANKYRQVPVDSISRLKIKKRVFKVVDDAEYNNINKPFSSTADKETTDQPVPGMHTKGSDITNTNPETEINPTDSGAQPKTRLFSPKAKDKAKVDEPESDTIDTDDIGRADGSDDELDDDERSGR